MTTSRPHLSTNKCQRVSGWAVANNVEIAYPPTNSSWLNRIEAQFTALRYFTLDGTDHTTHKEQGSMIRRYISWRNRHTDHQHLRGIDLNESGSPRQPGRLPPQPRYGCGRQHARLWTA